MKITIFLRKKQKIISFCNKYEKRSFFETQRRWKTLVVSRFSFKHLKKASFILITRFRNRILQLLPLAFLVQFSGCGGQKLDLALQKVRDDTIKVFDKFSAEEHSGFLKTFRTTVEKVANETFTGSELKARLKFIKDLDATFQQLISNTSTRRMDPPRPSSFHHITAVRICYCR